MVIARAIEAAAEDMDISQIEINLLDNKVSISTDSGIRRDVALTDEAERFLMSLHAANAGWFDGADWVFVDLKRNAFQADPVVQATDAIGCID